MMKENEREETSAEVTSDSQILPLVKREMALVIVKIAAVFGALSFLAYWIDGSTMWFYLFPAFFLAGGLIHVGKYISISNRHDSLVSKYGDVYGKEVILAANKIGISKLITTRWFESYAGIYCKRSAAS